MKDPARIGLIACEKNRCEFFYSVCIINSQKIITRGLAASVVAAQEC